MLLPILLSVLSGILYVLSFAPWDLGPLLWVAFVPLFFAVEKSPKTFLLGFITQFLICVGGFHWISYAVARYGELPELVSYILLLLFSCVGQLQVPIYLWARKKLQSTPYFCARPFVWPWFGALLYAGIEALYPKLFSDTAGNAFYKMAWTRQAVEIAGPFFLTFCALAVNEFLFLAVRNKDWKKLLAPIGMIGALNIYGAWRISQVESALQIAQQGPRLNVALIQANIGDYLKLASERGNAAASKEVIDQYLSLSQKAADASPPADLIVWPETAYPSLFGKSVSQSEYSMEGRVRMFAHHFPGTLAFGGYDTDIEKRDYNSFFFFRGSEDSTPLEVYHKSILLQFGETLPGADYFPQVKKAFPTMGFFGQGLGPQVIQVKDFSVAPSICYEALFPGHARVGSELGSDFFLNVTNDSWFGPRGEPYLHLALSTYRSIENREYLVRSTNTGISAIVDPTGEITQRTGLFTAEVLTTAIPKRIQTWRVPGMIALVFVYFCEALAALAVAFVIVNRKKLKS